MEKRILIIGGNGFVGTNLARDLSEKHMVMCTYRESFTPIPNCVYLPYKTLADKDVAHDLVKRTEPEVVIYAVGSNDVQKGEVDPRETNYLHTAGANMILAASDNVKAKYIYISSDCVFNGAYGNFSESDTALPASQLGKAKISTENYIRSRSTNHIIIRSAPLLGRGPIQHPSWLDALRENEAKKLPCGVGSKALHNPVHISELSKLIMTAIENDVKNKTFHLGGLTKLTLKDLALKVFKQLDLDSALITAEDKDPRADMSDFSLNFSNVIRAFHSKPLSIAESIEALK